MKAQCCRLLAILFVLLVCQLAQGQRSATIEELRDQIQKLVAIDTDPAASTEVRNLNRGFLQQRRKQLVVLLKQRLTSFQSYQATVGGMLTPEETKTLAARIQNTLEEIKRLEPDQPAGAPSTEIASLAPPTGIGRETANPDDSSRATVTPAAAPPPSVTTAPQGSDNFNDWLSNRIDARIKSSTQARIDQRSNVNQTEAPALSDSSTSLVDQSSASDLIGVALNLAGLTKSSDDSNEKTSAAVTATAYSLYSTFRGEEPLDPAFYNSHRDWRRLSFTLGFEKGQTTPASPNANDTTIAGAKYLLIAHRDASYHQKELNTVYENIRAAAVSFAQLNKEVKTFLFFSDPTLRNKLRIADDVRFFMKTQIESSATNPDDKKQFEALLKLPEETWFEFEKEDQFANVRQDIKKMVDNKWLGQGFPNLLKALGEDGLKQIDQFIDARLEAFTSLNTASRRAIEQIRKAPQLSISFQSKLRKVEPDEYLGELIFDYGVHDRINLTINGSYFYKNSRLIGADIRRAKFAGQLQFQMTPEKSLIGRSPLYFFLASEGDWGSGIKSVFKVQGKVKIPIVEGIDFPISLTYANRTDLINERDVRGQFGFTIDSAKLFRAFLTK
jgi:hypothetical protein